MDANARFLLLTVLTFSVKCNTDMNNTGTAGRDIDGQTLIKLGRKFNKPVLTILGMAISNLHQCSEWSKWTECDATTANFFGTRNRTRQCGPDKANNIKTSKTKMDFIICEGGSEGRFDGSEGKSEVVCPENYRVTTNGFCIKLYDTPKNHDDAETECQKDGGFLINIDSSLKHADVKSILEGQSATDINVGGRRKDSSSQWEFKYGATSGYFKWIISYPSSSSGRLCLAIEKSTSYNLENYLWWNLSCTSKYPFLCEIPV